MNLLSAAAVLGLFSSLALAGDPDSVRREEIVKSMLSAMGNLSKTLGTIRDEESAQAAKAPLKKAADDWLVLRKKAEDVPPPSPAEAERLAKEYKDKLEQSQKLLFGEITRVQQVPGGREALGELAKIFATEKKSAP